MKKLIYKLESFLYDHKKVNYNAMTGPIGLINYINGNYYKLVKCKIVLGKE